MVIGVMNEDRGWENRGLGVSTSAEKPSTTAEASCNIVGLRQGEEARTVVCLAGGVSGFHLVVGWLVGEVLGRGKGGGGGINNKSKCVGEREKDVEMWSAYLMVEERNEVRGRGSLSKRTRGSGSRVVTDDYM